MLFTMLKSLANKFPDRPALNDFTYSELINEIEDLEYNPICDKNNFRILLDIFKASQVNKPLIVIPLHGNFDLPKLNDQFNLYLYSSGSTNRNKKYIRLSESMIISNAINSIACNQINSHSRILTICTLHHTGGINAQTLPGLLAGSYVKTIDPNWYELSKIIDQFKITHTHITPRISNIIEKINHFDSKLDVVMCGSDCVTKSSVEFWTRRSKKFIINYGLTEAGPIIINHAFDINSDLSIFEKGVPLGTRIWTDYMIKNRELFLKGTAVSHDKWLPTDDCVEIESDWFIYKGRKSAGCKIIPKRY